MMRSLWICAAIVLLAYAATMWLVVFSVLVLRSGW